MWIGVISVLPELFAGLTTSGVVARGIAEGRLHLEFVNPRDFARDKYQSVDDRPFGGGAGMVMQAEPLAAAVSAAQRQAPGRAPVVLLSPQGRVFDQTTAQAGAGLDSLIFVCGRYEGVDERFIQRYVDEQWSIGDFVVSGGELPAMTVIDAIARQIPGVLGNSRSIIDESHLDGTLEYPQYTRPENTVDLPVPAVLLSGDHGRIQRYRRREALRRTFERRPEMLTCRVFSAEDRKLLVDCFENEASNAKKQNY